MPRIDLAEFDAYLADRAQEHADRGVPALVVMGQMSKEAAVEEQHRLRAYAERVRADGPHRGKIVALKDSLTYGEVLDARTAAIRRDDQDRPYTDSRAYEAALMVAMIDYWSLTDADGRPIPVDAQSVMDRDEHFGKWLYERVEDQRASYLRGPEQMEALKSDAAGGAVPE